MKTRHADETEQALRETLPKRYWKEVNELLVAFGQNLCKPLSPMCSRCGIYQDCRRIGVVKSR